MNNVRLEGVYSTSIDHSVYQTNKTNPLAIRTTGIAIEFSSGSILSVSKQ
jgi:hypothetical protein